jgi:NTP pyrophosphatase (non-canonical NTP hydrolase)
MTDNKTMLNNLTREAHETAVEHGFYEEHHRLVYDLRIDGLHDMADIVERDFELAQIAKIASECGEAVAAIQHGEDDGTVAEELADVVIRTFDLAGHMGVDFGEILTGKMERNKQRPYKHGKVC